MIKAIKTKTQISKTEQDLPKSKILDYNDELILNLKRSKNKPSAFPYHQIVLSLYQFEFLKSYLYRLYENMLSDDKIEVISFLTTNSTGNPATCSPQISSSSLGGISVVDNQVVYVDLLFDGIRYQVSVFLKLIDNSGSNLQKHFIGVLGTENNSVQPTKLIDYLIYQSIRNSIFKNKLIKIKIVDDSADVTEMEIKEFENEKLEHIFIPQTTKDEIERFYECVYQYDKVKMGLRYLFSGEPGTGKTKTIRALINKCYGKSTIIISEGEADFSELFRFAELFDPAILIIDDLDLKITDRNIFFNNSNLGGFLQELDGFRKNNVFVLATTNSKELLDKAASRPGRFDMLIDFKKLKKENYLDIIKTYCQDERILEIFDDKVLEYLKNKKLTGAFLTNLLKQLKIKLAVNPNVDLKSYLNNLMEFTYKGFYKKQGEMEDTFGFSSHKQNGIEVIDL